MYGRAKFKSIAYSVAALTFIVAMVTGEPPVFEELPSIAYTSDRKMVERFPTKESLEAIYISEAWKSVTVFNSYKDLHRYTLCEGPKLVQGRNYPFYICPEDVAHPLRHVCCYDTFTKERQCCRKEEGRQCDSVEFYAVIKGIAAGVSALVGGLAIYWCVRRIYHSRDGGITGSTSSFRRRPIAQPRATSQTTSPSCPTSTAQQCPAKTPTSPLPEIPPPPYEANGNAVQGVPNSTRC